MEEDNNAGAWSATTIAVVAILIIAVLALGFYYWPQISRGGSTATTSIAPNVTPSVGSPGVTTTTVATGAGVPSTGAPRGYP